MAFVRLHRSSVRLVKVKDVYISSKSYSTSNLIILSSVLIERLELCRTSVMCNLIVELCNGQARPFLYNLCNSRNNMFRAEPWTFDRNICVVGWVKKFGHTPPYTHLWRNLKQTQTLYVIETQKVIAFSTNTISMVSYLCVTHLITISLMSLESLLIGTCCEVPTISYSPTNTDSAFVLK